ncbi:response regulator receiver modulated diguanylate cyclase [Thioalkalivibrio sulfidiphilus HL-EbGr7]|uniref:diguanylate cyclase n=2 Tax=Thioalkalivibrio TaxID=106633 RepID=B8GLI2_THISH|nr:response regulator receiver modulated diguanylate cyclase [Thioalkalivibrio sulfidiphilus HL-EbGr7]
MEANTAETTTKHNQTRAEQGMVEDLAIVIVDDMQYSRAVLRTTLNRIGYTDIRMAGSASECLAMLSDRRAEVVLADWVMPEMNGLELTAAIRQKDDDRGHYTAIILFTGKEGDEPMMEAFRHGVDDYLTKPVNQTQLAARVYAAGRIARLQNTVLETSSALAAANRQLEYLSTTDPLTGLPNRRALNKRLEAVLLETQGRGGGMCVGLLDVDHFKQINDTYGHDVGDEVLTTLSKRLRLALRPMDMVARLGGEEFALVMHFHDVDNCNPGIFQRVLDTVSKDPFPTSEGQIPVTASIGACCYRHGEQMVTIQGMLKIADENLYRAKAEGRNRVVG